MKKYIAHPGDNSKSDQLVIDHLKNVAELTEELAKKINLGTAGRLIGLSHDLGKYSNLFQRYICSASGKINPDEDDYIDPNNYKGKVDHSSAGGQFILKNIKDNPYKIMQFVGQFLSVCVFSHHSGIIDIIDNLGDGKWENRSLKADELTHLSEVIKNADFEILEEIQKLVFSEELRKEFFDKIQQILTKNAEYGLGNRPENNIASFKIGLLLRHLFSCLIDADRTDTANFEDSRRTKFSGKRDKIEWKELSKQFEKKLLLMNRESNTNLKINQIRQSISQECLTKAEDKPGIFTLTVPTGGGKTLSSLRFALRHAEVNKLDRIFYIIPYTSIIDQNAMVVRDILGSDSYDINSIVLEHHSNLLPEFQTYRQKIFSENWDAPIVFTTMVQFLEALFSRGTSGARRMHQLGRSLLIFDEIQTLPVKCVHLFCNAINYLVDHANSSVVLCTATQPLLGELRNPQHGKLNISEENEIISDVSKLFNDLKRVEVENKIKIGGWSNQEIANFALNRINSSRTAKSCLIIVNTKKNAYDIYQTAKEIIPGNVVHLSTGMCAAHRMSVLEYIRKALKKNIPICCVSTQLIEAGVDVDFGTVIRSLAGLDSIAQASGRCNRNGSQEAIGKTYIVNLKEEELTYLKDIEDGAEITKRILNEYQDNPGYFSNSLLSEIAMKQYFKYYFHERAGDMVYKIPKREINREDDLLNLLGANNKVPNLVKDKLALYQSFKTAADNFSVIDKATRGVVVPFGERGRQIISELCGAYEVNKQWKLLKEAQRYSVNLFPHNLNKLQELGRIYEVQIGSGIFYLDERNYDQEFGVVSESSNTLKEVII